MNVFIGVVIDFEIVVDVVVIAICENENFFPGEEASNRMYRAVT
jgi:hypothetical protein